MGNVASGVGGIVGGILGQNMSSGAAGQAQDAAILQNQILQNIQQAPDISKPILLQQYKQQGLLTPEMEQAVQLGQSAVSQIGTDQGSLNAQRSALQQLSQQGQMGMTASERNALNQVQQEQASQVSGKQQQILNQLHAQAGGAGSMQGLALMDQLQAEQGGANAAAQQSSNVMANAQQAALQAASASGQLGGQINQQQFGEAATKAQAADQFQRFNVQAQQQAQNANVQAQNAAQQYNLNQSQNLANANTTSQNQEYYNQLQRQMQQYGANVGVAQIQSGGYGNLGNFYNNQATNQAQAGANIGAGLGGIFGGAANSMASNSPSQNSNPSGSPYGQSSQIGSAGGGLSALGTVFANQGGSIDFRNGGQVPGKEVVSGDSPRNDVIPAMLSANEHVTKKSIAQIPEVNHVLNTLNNSTPQKAQTLGKRLSKLLEDHHQFRKDIGE